MMREKTKRIIDKIGNIMVPLGLIYGLTIWGVWIRGGRWGWATSRMVLRFDKVDDIGWKHISYMEILEQADGLAAIECSNVPVPKNKEDATKWMCMEAITEK